MNLLSSAPVTVPLVVLLLSSGACDPNDPVGSVEGTTGSPEAPAGETSQITHLPRTSSIRLRNLDLTSRNHLLYEAELAGSAAGRCGSARAGT